jgi:hypothetical protein
MAHIAMHADPYFAQKVRSVGVQADQIWISIGKEA